MNDAAQLREIATPSRNRRLVDMTGRRVGRFTVLGLHKNNGPVKWDCLCDCGNERAVRSGQLRSGHSKSCGCLSAELAAQRERTHGQTKSRLYSIWSNMVQRCTNPKNTRYRDYGGRGITVCEEWLRFDGFLADMGQPPDGMTLDRKNNDLGYCKSNCRWATHKEQQLNKRSHRMVAVYGVSLCLSQWSELTGINVTTLWTRLDHGWSQERAILAPVQKQFAHRGSDSAENAANLMRQFIRLVDQIAADYAASLAKREEGP